MRLILAFVFGFLLCFYAIEILEKIGSVIIKKRALPFTYSFIGLLMIVGAIGLVIIGDPLQSGINFMIAWFTIGGGVGFIIHHLLSKRFLFLPKVEKDFVLKHETKIERALEIFPGAFTWIALTSPIWLSFTLPYAVAYLLLIADAYWLITALKIGILIILGYRKTEEAKKINWYQKLELEYPTELKKYYHLILLPTYKEALYILTPAFSAILNSTYPKEKIMIAVGFEERDDPQKIKEVEEYLKEHVEKQIKGVFTTVHPYNLPGEVAGQGSNKNWMIKHIVPALNKKHIDINDVYVTTLDADFCIHPQFLAGSLHKYLSLPADERDKRTYTGVFLYHNNYWQTPTPMRLMATGTSFWQMAEMVGSDKYMNYSSMSISLKALLDIGGWIPDKVNDDNGFYWKAYFHFKGDYKVIPHFLPISADAVQDTTLLKSFQNQYLQIRRWAYGVEHIPFIVKEYFTQDIDFWNKTDRVIFKIWGDLKWGFLAIFVTFGGLLIPLVNPGFRTSVVSINLPIVSSWILTAAFFGLFATIYVHEKTAPPRPKEWSFIRKFWSYIQWLLLPVILITISSIPAIDAQTSLMFGKKLEFRVTNKARLK